MEHKNKDEGVSYASVAGMNDHMVQILDSIMMVKNLRVILTACFG